VSIDQSAEDRVCRFMPSAWGVSVLVSPMPKRVDA